MKMKIILAIALLLIVGAQAYYSLYMKDAGKAEPSVSPVAGDEQAAKAPAPVPAPESVVGVSVSAGGPALELRMDGDGWVVVSRNSIPADAEKIDRFLDALLRGERQPPPLNAEPSTTGLDDGATTVRLTLAGGEEYDVRIGLHPEGDLGAAFARFGDGGTVVLESDVRGELGLWRNEPGQAVDADAWIVARIFRFDPDEAVRLAASYPDHEIVFEREAGGEWRSVSRAPGGEWNREALASWLEDLSALAVTGFADADELAGAACGVQPVSLELTLADGGVKTLHACLDPSGEGMHVGVGDLPGRIFELPMWRYKKYFLRLATLYPGAVPRFAPGDIRLVDIRKGGDSVKISRVDGEWRQAGLPHPLRTERVERLARLVSGLSPEDFADPAAKTPRTASAGPVVDILLADGVMHQYRLGGRHPLFPWRYVAVDGGETLSLADPEAGVLFPGLEEILDLGLVFAGLDASALSRVELIRTEDGTRLLAIRRENGEWLAENERTTVTLTPDEAERLTERPTRWRVAGLYEPDSRLGGTDGVLRLRLADASGNERGIMLLPPQGRDIPFMADGERPLLLERSDFFIWLGAVRTLSRRIDEAAARLAAEENAAAKPAEEAVEQPAGEPAGETAEEPVGESAGEPAGGIDAESTGESDAGSVRESAVESAGEPAVESVEMPAEAPVETVDETLAEEPSGTPASADAPETTESGGNDHAGIEMPPARSGEPIHAEETTEPAEGGPEPESGKSGEAGKKSSPEGETIAVEPASPGASASPGDKAEEGEDGQ